MQNRARLLRAALGTALALALGAASANAARSFSITSNSSLTYIAPRFRLDFGVTELTCDVTLTASLHAAAAKARGTLIGFVNGGKAANCSNDFTLLVEHRRPWHLAINSFRGTLPRISEVLMTIRGFAFLLGIPDPFLRRIGCLYRGDLGVETAGRAGAGEYTIERIVPQAGNTVPLFEDGLDVSPFLDCPEQFEVIGTFTASLPPVVRLI